MKRLKIKFARRDFRVARDSAGVPHVEAADWLAALYGLGYMHALDRPTQMFFSQALASGRSAELIADRPQMVEADRFFRRVGLYLGMEDEIHMLDPEIVAQLNAYCEGVHDGLRQGGRSLPMHATRFQPGPWSPAAVLLIGNLLNYGGLAVSQQQNERLLVELVQAGVDRAKLQELFAPQLDKADFELLNAIHISNRLSDEALELLTDLPRLAGSNAWAVSPERSATGHALLASDPHLEVNRLPAIWYEAVLTWGDQYIMGATLPGCPIFAIARTPWLAWGVTYLKGDTSDFFIEDCRCEDGVWQFRRGDNWINFAVREETILRKRGDAVVERVYYNDQGTLDADLEQTGPGYCLSTAWAGAFVGVGRSIETWLRIVKAPSTLEAMDIVRECPTPTLCWVFADREGHIGRQANGWFPKRNPDYDGLLPIPAWDVRNHWQGWHPVDVLPRIYDPPEGFIASANENINQPGGPMLVTQPVPDYRKRRVDECLRALPKATVEAMQAIQYDVISLQARDLLKIFLPHMPDGPLKERLSAWDCSYDPSSHEATLFSRLYRNVLLEIFGRVGGLGWRRMLYLSSRVGFSMMIVYSIDRLLHREESLWWEGRGKGNLIRRAAERTSIEPDVPWAKVNSFRFTNRYFDTRVGKPLGIQTGDIPMPGCHATPFQGHLLRAPTHESTFAPSYHFVTDLGADEAWTNLPGGPKESWLSRWYRSDIPLWREGRYKRLTPKVE